MPLLVALMLVALAIVAASAVLFGNPAAVGMARQLTDFHVFHIAGGMAAHGQAADAYDVRQMIAAQRATGAAVSFLPWSYPPPYMLIVRALAALPLPWAYASFAVATFAAYVLMLRRIAGRYLPGVLIGVMPAIVLNLRTGQNGFLIATLAGLCLILARGRRPRLTGIPLGLMILKPHLALGVGLWLAIRRQFAVMLAALLVALAAMAAATVVYGTGVWLSFWSALHASGAFLAAGLYPMFRMTSIYASLYSLGAPVVAALIAQAAVAAAAMAMLAVLVVRKVPFAWQAAAACAATLSISPYCYDYDLALLGVAFAFLAEALAKRSSAAQALAIWGLAWFAGGQGMIVEVLMEHGSEVMRAKLGTTGLTLSAPSLIGLYITVWISSRSRAARRSNIAHAQSRHD